MFRCHGRDKKGKECQNSIGFIRYFMVGLCLECEIERDEMDLKLKKEKLKRQRRFRR